MSLTPEQCEEIALACYEDPPKFCTTFLPEWFPTPLAWFQLGLLAVLLRRADFLFKYPEWMRDKIARHFVYNVHDQASGENIEVPIFVFDEDNRTVLMRLGNYTMIMIPRGYGKTTVVNSVSMMLAAYHESEFFLYMSETATHAETQLTTVKEEMETNELYIAVFGQKKPDQRQNLAWRSDLLQTNDGVMAKAVGRGGQVRGTLVKAKRPDLGIMDDIEDDESVLTPEQREKALSWVIKTVMPALPRLGKRGTLVWLGTLLHPEAAMTKFWNDPEWTVVRLGAIDRDGEALWDANFTLEELEAKKDEFSRVGQLPAYYREYHNIIKGNAENVLVNYKVQSERKEDLLELPLALAVDPAISDKKEADYFALAVVAMFPGGRKHIVHFYGKQGVSAPEQRDMIFDVYKEWRPTYVGIESIAYQTALIHIVREQMFRRKLYFNIEPIKHGNTRKHERVEGILVPQYSNGYVTHDRVFPVLEQQLREWPNGKKDGPDVVSMAIALLEPAAAMAIDPDYDPTAPEYEPHKFEGELVMEVP